MDSSEYDKMYQLEETNWWYSGRRRLILKAVARLHKKHSDKSMNILDAGCGTGINLRYLPAYGDAYGLDISKEALEFSRIRGLSSLICGSVDSLPLKNEFFDLVVALDVIEHIQEDLTAVRELNRVLRPGGSLIVTVPAFQFLWSNHDLAVHHKKRYTRSELRDILGLGGFIVERATYWNFFLFLPVAVMRMLKRATGSQRNKQTDLAELPAPINSILNGLLWVENSILGWFDLPFGVSVMCVCRKPRDGQS
jgi:SAM-dependent methyltransferase